MTTVKHSYDAPTEKQLAFAENLAKKAGFRFGVSEAMKAMRGKAKIGAYNRAEMSELIDWLQNTR